MTSNRDHDRRRVVRMGSLLSLLLFAGASQFALVGVLGHRRNRGHDDPRGRAGSIRGGLTTPIDRPRARPEPGRAARRPGRGQRVHRDGALVLDFRLAALAAAALALGVRAHFIVVLLVAGGVGALGSIVAG